MMMMSQSKTILALVIGFSLGVTVTFLFSTALQSNKELTTWNVIPDEEQNRPQYNKLKTTTATTTTTKTTMKELPNVPVTTTTMVVPVSNINKNDSPSAIIENKGNSATTTTMTTSAMTTTAAKITNVVVDSPPPRATTTTTTRADVVEFEHQPGGVIVTKIHGPDSLKSLEQSLCLLQYAYNNRVQYDIIVFTANPLPESAIKHLRQMVAPVNFTVVLDNPGLLQLVQRLTPDQQTHLLQRCNVTSPETLTWKTTCFEKTAKGGKTDFISYTWQAEFRALHIWNQPILQPYKYMLWLDTDGFCTRTWRRDPIATMVKHDLVLLFDNFPMGASRDPSFTERYRTAFNKTLCWISLDNDGHLIAQTKSINENCIVPNPQIKQVHGFFHVTNLDFYRSPPVMHWFRTLIGNTSFSRQYDDQIAVTVPAAILEPHRSWDMNKNGLDMRVFHNFVMDGKGRNRIGGFLKWWRNNSSESFPEAHGNCRVSDPGR